jgi:hypothetical protein
MIYIGLSKDLHLHIDVENSDVSKGSLSGSVVHEICWKVKVWKIGRFGQWTSHPDRGLSGHCMSIRVSSTEMDLGYIDPANLFPWIFRSCGIEWLLRHSTVLVRIFRSRLWHWANPSQVIVSEMLAEEAAGVLRPYCGCDSRV